MARAVANKAAAVRQAAGSQAALVTRAMEIPEEGDYQVNWGSLPAYTYSGSPGMVTCPSASPTTVFNAVNLLKQ